MKQTTIATKVATKPMPVNLVPNKAKQKAKVQKPYVMPNIVKSKIEANLNHKKMIGGFNFILSSIKSNAKDYIKELHDKYENIIVSVEDIEKLQAKDLSIFLTDKDKERQKNNGNLWGFWQVLTLVNRYYADKNKSAKK